MHVVLLGDSVFDNAAYVAGGPDVCAQLRQRLPEGWRATLLALDGSTTDAIPAQLARLPGDASHLVVSVGGNDALGHMTALTESAHSVGEVLDRLASIGDEFDQNYCRAVSQILERRLPTVLCSIYSPRFPDPVLQRQAVTALSVFNDHIIREAFRAGLPLLDLRLICDDDADFANPIEPSAAGGAKIAGAIVRAIREHDFARRRTQVFIGR
jgi:hypothetical protein